MEFTVEEIKKTETQKEEGIEIAFVTKLTGKGVMTIKEPICSFSIGDRWEFKVLEKQEKLDKE